MAFTNTFDTTTPPGGGDPSEADDRMRETKAATQERENVDHYWPLTGTEVSDEDAGEHRKVTIRTLTVDEVAALSATKAYLYRLVTDGELYFKDVSGNTIQLSDKGNNLANDTYLTGTDQAETGSVDLIKAGRNEVDDADVVIIPDAARMASNAAPGEDTGIANKKFVVDKVAAKHLAGAIAISQLATGGVQIKTGTYTGNGSATQAITGVGFQTAIVWAFKNEVNVKVFLKTNTMGLNTVGVWLNGWYATDYIISLDADGFTVGDGTPQGNQLNVNGKVYSYIAIGIN